jgi:UDP-N-acetylglucosamine pyrophosphorylase
MPQRMSTCRYCNKLKRLFDPTRFAWSQQCNKLMAEALVHDSVMSRAAQKLLSQTAVLKLNGGLGTSMGLEKAKSLLEVRTWGGKA